MKHELYEIHKGMMAGFTENALSKKLADLNNSQQSIQTLSLWLIHHRKHHAAIVRVWYRELSKAKEHRKLTFMYLANDVIQNSKKKGPEYGKEFGNVLKKVFEHMSYLDVDDKNRSGFLRILQIWEERGVYDAKQIKDWKMAFEKSGNSEPPKKKAKAEKSFDEKMSNSQEKNFNSSAKNKEQSYHEVQKVSSKDTRQHVVRERKKSETEVEIEIDGRKEVHTTLSPHRAIPAGDPPEPEELIKALLDLENSASSDAVVRERIASLPPEVSEVSLLSKLEDKGAADKLSVQVNEALQLLMDYNSRLAEEMEDRKRVSAMLRDFLQAQRDLYSQAEERLEEYTDKLQKVYLVRQELKSHIQNLPDLTQLPDVTGGLAPLPSAGDLFSLH
ncbi:regulation of nuclear pre-mRNA domain-containing protein 1B [Ischnura elegans]|uniref:regulation of nuclear pre-mRNA domain-containing protein 1B n=1 Tax=Ischnura elegans TaxID=197161 RepID=UPI001ED89DFA|nr:regulation of nuclear pre-mRNA domain-containing protein 1B [Ischnura elegans]